MGDELGCSSGPLGESLQRQGLVKLTKLSFNLEVVKVPLDGGYVLVRGKEARRRNDLGPSSGPLGGHWGVTAQTGVVRQTNLR